jgi:inhibitor of cysteine peptidase
MQVAGESNRNRTTAAVLAGAVIGIATVVAIVAVVGISLPGSSIAIPQGLHAFDSYSQMQQYVTANAKSAQQYGRSGVWFGGAMPMMFGGATTTESATMALTAAASSVQGPSFTGTNVQVQGVDEPDRVKSDGTHLFVSSGNNVTIINAYPPNSTSIASALHFPNSTVVGLEISQGRLLVIDQKVPYVACCVFPYGVALPIAASTTVSGGSTSIDLLLFDTTSVSSPRLMANVSVAGDYVAARLSDGYLYAVIQQSAYSFSNGSAVVALPAISADGVKTSLSPSSVYYTSNDSQISYYTMIASVDMSTGGQNVKSVLTGPSSTVYVSPSNIYVVYTNYADLFSTHGIIGDAYTGGTVSISDVQQAQNSTIVRVAYSAGSVTVAASGVVPGSVLNQFSLDEYNGYFRVATGRFAVVDGTPTRSDDVYVMNMSMSQVSSLKNIAPGENIYAVRFVGETGYVVTFEQIDPLFVISFKDVVHPVVQSALKVSGYSDYLHPLPGGYLIGVGKDAVQSSMQNVAFYTSLKLSLFRVFDNGTSTQVSKLLIGDRGTDSPVLTDHLAFTFDPSRNVTVIPLTLYVVSGNQTTCSGCPPPYGDPVWQGVYVIKVNSSGFTKLGEVSQYPPGQNFGDSPYYNLQIDRSVIIGGYLYTVSQGEVMVSSMQSFSTVATIQLQG